MSYKNRRGRIGRNQRFKSFPSRRSRINRYNPSINRIRRGRIQAFAPPRAFNSIPRDRLFEDSEPMIGLSLSDTANSALDVGAFTFGGGLVGGPIGLAIGGTLGGLYEYARHRWPNSQWMPYNWW